MKQVLITGGSRGIGAAAVRLFAARGCRVAFLYEKNEAAARALSAKTGAEAIRCDVADGPAVERAVAGLAPVDILINNAGLSHVGLISQITPEQWDRLFAVNVKGIYHTVRAVLPGMLQKQAGCILNVSSMWGQVGASCEAAYSATKGAVDALTKALAKELGPSGIRVNGVSPGMIDTDMNAHLSAEDVAALAEETPLGRIGTPEQVAEALWDLSRAEFITGQILAVNGGLCIT
ncbi:MAG: SDR family oxidoreductase [Oscillospiraceae bacterium]|nr:SDR family oxidoreductase [Oscillospiraceae bacterium]